MTFVAPNPFARSFTCPHCGVLARQRKWGHTADGQGGLYGEGNLASASIRVSKCEHCGKNCLWFGDDLVFPNRGLAPQPNPDMPADCLEDYEEAARIYSLSPRGAAALLRLCIQKLMVALRQPGKNINDDIAALVLKGLPATIQQALDVVRVTGNNAVHPGEIDVDSAEVVESLFGLINVIVESQISVPLRISSMYATLPEAAKRAIARRDGQKTS